MDLDLDRHLGITQSELYSVCTKWYNIGVQLQIPVHKLDRIKSEYSESGDCLRETLKDWLKRDTPTWNNLVSALKSGPVDECKLAEKLNTKYCSRSDVSQTESEPLESVHSSPLLEIQSISEEEGSRPIQEQESDCSSGISLDNENVLYQQDFMCGCGQCSLSSWLEKGCPNASEQNTKYPFLDSGRLSHKEYRALLAKLDGECKKIECKFGKLVYGTQTSLISRHVSVEQLASCLSDLKTYEAVYPNKPMLFHRLDDIHNAKNIYEVFWILNDYRSFFNYHIIEFIIDTLGTPEDEERLSTYKEDLKLFLKRRIFECPENVCKPLGGDHKTDLVVKIGKSRSETEFYMTEISSYQQTVSEILGLNIASLLLCHITKGCVQLTFQIPDFVEADGKIFPLGDKQTDALRAKRIIKLTCGDFSWECEQEITPEEVLTQQVLSLGNATSAGENSPGATSVIDETDDCLPSLESSNPNTNKDFDDVVLNESETSRLNPLEPSNALLLETKQEIQASKAALQSHLLSEEQDINVCRQCFSSNTQQKYLLVRKCLSPQQHRYAARVSVIWSDGEQKLIQIRPMPSILNYKLHGYFIRCNGWRCRGEKCTFAHSIEERERWNSLLKKHRCCVQIQGTILQGVSPPHHASFASNRSSFHSVSSDATVCVEQTAKHKVPLRSQSTSEVTTNITIQPMLFTSGAVNKSTSANIHTATVLEQPLSRETYRERFRKLLWLEEKEHEEILVARCDGLYTLVLHQAGLKKPPWLTREPIKSHSRIGYLLGMNGDQIAYATQASEAAEMIFEATKVRTTILMDNYHHGEERLYIAIGDRDVKILQQCLHMQEKGKEQWSKKVEVHFKLKHSYFRNMGQALDKLSDSIIKKLIPKNEDFDPGFHLKPIPFPKHYKYLQLDRFQFKALRAAVFTKSNAPPVLIAGPFGTGKTRLLATAAHYFLEQRQQPAVRILVCTHHHASADTFIDCYFGLMKADQKHPWGVQLTRVTRLTATKQYHHSNHWFVPVDRFMTECLHFHHQKLLVVTTFLTALHLTKEIPAGYFTHILIDEGAQTREPETIAPLCLASKDTKIVIAGDHWQVGPALLVLGQKAQKYGLGQSLLERLHELYRKYKSSKNYCTTLLTNYRSHPQILNLLSVLFYHGALSHSSRASDSRLHPHTRFPLIFICSSDNDAEPSTDEDKYLAEAENVLTQVEKYTFSWPDEIWGPRNLNEICIMTPTRNQVNAIKSHWRFRRLKGVPLQILPTYMMQGREFRAVFLSTSEPTEHDFRVKNPTKSICDPYVFNTAITRAKSLVVSVGNPFTLLKIEKHMIDKYGEKGKCWTNYLGRCLRNNTILFPTSTTTVRKFQCLKKLRRLLETRPSIAIKEEVDSIQRSYQEMAEELNKAPAHLPLPKWQKATTTQAQQSDVLSFQIPEQHVPSFHKFIPQHGVTSPNESDCLHSASDSSVESNIGDSTDTSSYHSGLESGRSTPTVHEEHQMHHPLPPILIEEFRGDKMKSELESHITSPNENDCLHSASVTSIESIASSIGDSTDTSGYSDFESGRSTPIVHAQHQMHQPLPTVLVLIEELSGDKMKAELESAEDTWDRESVLSESSGISEISIASSREHSSDTSGYESDKSAHSLTKQIVSHTSSLVHTAIHYPKVKAGIKGVQTSKLSHGHGVTATLQIDPRLAEFETHSTYYKTSMGSTKAAPNSILIKKPLKRKCYHEKLHHLLLLEEDAHIQNIITRCNGKYTLTVYQIGHTPNRLRDRCKEHIRYGYLSGKCLDADIIASVKESSGGVLTLKIAGCNERIYADIVHARGTRECIWIAFDWDNIQKLTKPFPRAKDEFQVEAQVEFKCKPDYFDDLHCALLYLPLEVIDRLFPREDEFFVKTGSVIPTAKYSTQSLDELQQQALKSALNLQENTPPMLVSGPSGSGVSHALACITYSLLKSMKTSRILVCTYQHSSADSFLERYLDLTEDDESHAKNVHLTRLVHDSNYKNKRKLKYRKFYDTLPELHNYLESVHLLITTCLQSLHLVTQKPKEEESPAKPGFFTHILIDKSSQMIEPELVACLTLANSSTRIIIAGDNYQVGSLQAIQSTEAQEGHLGLCLQQRLNVHYSKNNAVISKPYSFVLSSSYRTHREILALLSKLLYTSSLVTEDPYTLLVSRDPNPSLHPNTKYPLYFVCSSIDGMGTLPNEEMKRRQKSAVLEQVMAYTHKDSWPKEKWGKAMENACIVVTTNEEKSIFQSMIDDSRDYRTLKQLKVHKASKLHGHVNRAVFLSAEEQTAPDGQCLNLIESLSNPYVFNTVLTHAQSLVVSVGNPFSLLEAEKHMVAKYNEKGKCWSEYLRLCFWKGTFTFSESLDANDTQKDKCQQQLEELLQVQSY